MSGNRFPPAGGYSAVVNPRQKPPAVREGAAVALGISEQHVVPSPQLSEKARQLVDKVAERVGVNAAMELECLLKGQLSSFHTITTDEIRAIQAMAKNAGVILPS